MVSSETGTLIHVAQRRFQSFSEAADALLQALAQVVPGVVALGRLDADEGIHRVIEARGEGLSGLGRGAALVPAEGSIDPDFLRSLGAQDWLCAPLEMNDGRIVGVVCAADSRPGVYRPEHSAELGLIARLLSHEWESVELRSELRRLRGRVNAGPSTDPDTGLPNREGFLDLLNQEWRLAEEGTVESVLVVCRVGGDGDGGQGTASAKQRLALKLTADVLKATTRGSDRAGRVAEMTVGAILVGCKPEDTPSFVARFLGALERVADGGQAGIRVSCGVQPLAGTSAPQEALELAEAAAGEAGDAENVEGAPEAAVE
jgi:GGDEF domain-containing protein